MSVQAYEALVSLAVGETLITWKSVEKPGEHRKPGKVLKNLENIEKPGKALASLTLSSSSWTTVAATHLSLPYEAEQQNGQWTRHLGKFVVSEEHICTSVSPAKSFVCYDNIYIYLDCDTSKNRVV